VHAAVLEENRSLSLQLLLHDACIKMLPRPRSHPFAMAKWEFRWRAMLRGILKKACPYKGFITLLKCMKLIAFSITAFLIVLTATAQAQISWGAIQTITGNASDIRINGTFFDAINTSWNGTNFVTTTVGDTTFNELTLNPVSGRFTSDGTITDSVMYGDGNFGGTGAPTQTDTLDDTAYGYVLNHASDGVASVTIGSALHPLTLGDEYQVQVWGYWGNTNYGAQLNGANTVDFPNGGGGYFIGTFTASATTQAFSYQGNAMSYGKGFVNDIAVRDIPEPSTYAMMLGGIGMLVLIARFRHKLTA
jgi:hypothetical protein